MQKLSLSAFCSLSPGVESPHLVLIRQPDETSTATLVSRIDTPKKLRIVNVLHPTFTKPCSPLFLDVKAQKSIFEEASQFFFIR